jgi:hypothetical protein
MLPPARFEASDDLCVMGENVGERRMAKRPADAVDETSAACAQSRTGARLTKTTAPGQEERSHRLGELIFVGRNNTTDINVN